MTHNSIRYLCAALSAVGMIAQLYGMWLYPAAFGVIKTPRKRKRKLKHGARLRITNQLIDTGGLVMFCALTVFLIIRTAGTNEVWVRISVSGCLPINGGCLVLGVFTRGWLPVNGGWLVFGIDTLNIYPDDVTPLLPYAIAVCFGVIPLGAVAGIWPGVGLILANWALVARAEIIKTRRADVA